MIEIVVALLVVGVIVVYLNHLLGFFNIIPAGILSIILLAIAIDVVLFVIHRKD